MGNRNRVFRLATAIWALGTFGGAARADIIHLPPPVDVSFAGDILNLPPGMTLSDAMVSYSNYISGTLEQVYVIPATLTPDGNGYTWATPAVALPITGDNYISFVAEYADAACPTGTSGCGVYLTINNNWLSTENGPLVTPFGSDPGGSTFAFGNSFEELTGIDEDVFKSQLEAAYARATSATPSYFPGSSGPQLGDYIAGDAGGNDLIDEAIDQSFGDGLEVAAAGSIATGGAVSNLTADGTIDFSVQVGSGVQPTPEPSSLLLLGSSLAALTLLRLRQR